MSRTNRRPSFHPAWFRRPKGFKQAKINNVRIGAIPPNEYTEIFVSSEACKCMERRMNNVR